MGQLYAKIKRSSKYFVQNDWAENDPFYGLPFAVEIDPECLHPVSKSAVHDDYCVKGGPGGQYQLRDVNLFMRRGDGAMVRIK